MLRDQIISQINTLEAEELMLVYGYIELLKEQAVKVNPAKNDAHLLILESSKGLKTSLSEDIIAARAETI